MPLQYAGPFEGMKFPKYEHREFPKWVKDTKGQDVLVNDKREELAVISTVAEGEVDPVLAAKNKLLVENENQKDALAAKERIISDLQKSNDEQMKLLKEMGDRLMKLAPETPATSTSPTDAAGQVGPATSISDTGTAAKPKAFTPLDKMLKGEKKDS